MSTRRRTLTLALVLGGCATTSIRGDLQNVERLTSVTLSTATLVGDEVDPVTSSDVRTLLLEALTVDKAVSIALLNNRELRATLRGLGIDRGRLVQAGVLPNPAVELTVKQDTERQEPLLAELAVEWNLTRVMLAHWRSGVAEHRLQAAQAHAAQQVLELGHRVRAAVYALAAAEMRYQIGLQNLDTLAAGRDAAQALLAAGNMHDLDASTHHVAYENARADVAELELAVLDRREELQEFLGLHGDDTTWTLAEVFPSTLPTLSVPADLEQCSIAASLSLAEMKSQLSALAKSTGLTQAEGLIPNFSLGVLAEQEVDHWLVGAQARMTLPIFDRQQGTQRAQEAEFDALLERYYGEAIRLRSVARRQRNRLLSDYARAKQYQDVIVPARAEVTKQTLLQYNAMQVGLFQLLAARRGEFVAQLAYVNTLADVWTDKSALDTLLQGHAVGGGAVMPPVSFGVDVAEAGGH